VKIFSLKKLGYSRRTMSTISALAIAASAFIAVEAPSSVAFAAAPNDPTITDIVRNDAARTLTIYFTTAATGTPATSVKVETSCDWASQTFNTVTSPVTINYANFCVSDGGIDGYWNTKPSYYPVGVYLTAINSSGPSQQVSQQVYADMQLSIPQITSTVAYKGGCLANFMLRSYPAWVTRIGAGVWDGPNAYSGGAAVSSTFDPATGTGSFYHSYDAYSSWGQDRAIQTNFDAGHLVNSNWVGVRSLRSVEFSCPDNPSGPATQPATPAITVNSGNGGFTVNWSVANTGSHPVQNGYLTIFSSATGSGPSSLYTSNPMTTANITQDCLQENPQTVFKYNTYCQSPYATEAVVSSAQMRTSGSFSSDDLVDAWNNPITIVNGRTYWVAFRLETTASWNATAANSSSASNLVEIFPGAVPTVTSVSPSSGAAAGGTPITITGTGYAAGATVTVGGQACTNVTVVSSTSITCTTPSGSAGAQSVVVDVSTRQNTANSLFTYVAAALSPATRTVTGTAGTAITATSAYSASNFAGTVSYAVTSGSLPSGLTLNASTGVISGTPTSSSSASITITATGSGGGSATTAVSFNISAAPATTTTVPASSASADAPKLVTAADVAKLEQAPNSATAVVNGQVVAVKVVEAPVTSDPTQLQQAAASIVNTLDKLTPAGSTNPVKVVNTTDGAELTGLLSNPDNPTEKLNVPVEAVKLLQVGNNSAVLLAAMNQTNLPADLSPSGAIEVTRGGILAARAYGLGASENGEIVLMSTPRLLQSFTVSSSGTYNGQVPLPKDIAFGSHTVVMATSNAKVSLGITLVRTKMQFRIKRVIGTTLFKNRAGVKKAGGTVKVTGSGACKATNTKVTMGSKAGACFITVSQAAKGAYKALTYRFTVSVVTKLIKAKSKK